MTDVRERADELAEDLIGAADYLKTALDAGKGVYESKWLDTVMVVHGFLLELADAPPSDSQHSIHKGDSDG